MTAIDTSVKSPAKPEAQPEAQSEVTPEAKTEIKSEAKPEAKSQELAELILAFEKINSLYWIEEPAETLKLLLGHEAILPLVIEAYDKIRELFAEAKLALKVERDPEIPGWRSLWITIYPQLDSDEAFKKLKTLDYNWWLDAGYAVGNKLNIDLGWE